MEEALGEVEVEAAVVNPLNRREKSLLLLRNEVVHLPVEELLVVVVAVEVAEEEEEALPSGNEDYL